MTSYYILCPGGLTTGGPELLHQLVYTLKSLGANAQIAYYGNNKSTPQKYQKYVNADIPIEDIPDTHETVIVVPETAVERILPFTKATLAIWWLSVDNFRLLYSPKYQFQHFSKLNMYRFFKCFFFQLQKKSNLAITKANYHLYQSEYARTFIEELGIDPQITLRLSDYLNNHFLGYATQDLTRAALRHDQVLYNPKKGLNFTNKLMASTPTIKWIPLQGYTNEELVNLMLTSKLYVDFGNHPGKDRLPREAAACGTCVLIGDQGAAKFEEDYPLPAWAKFSNHDDAIPSIVTTIGEIFNNFETFAAEEENYRKMISSEKSRFLKDVRHFIKVIENQ